MRIAFIDPLSGPTARVGRNALLSWQFMARTLGGADNPAGVQLTVAGFDNKGSPQESLNAMKAAIDQGFRYIVQGSGSGVASVIVEAVERHNLRFPDRTVLYINYTSVDPVLTQQQCSYWQVGLDAGIAMKTLALARFFASQAGLERVYLLNQSQSQGLQVSRHFKEAMKRVAPRVAVAGEETYPFSQGQNLEPLVQRIRACGAQALVAAHWGSDLQDLVNGMLDVRVETPLYAFYPSHPGVPALLSDRRRRFPVFQVACGHPNLGGAVGVLAQAFRRETGEDLVFHAAYDGVAMLVHAMRFAESTDVARVAARISGMLFKGFNGPVQVSPDDHHLQKGVYVTRWEKASAEYPVAAEETGFTFAPVRYFDAGQLSGEPTCKMRRP